MFLSDINSTKECHAWTIGAFVVLEDRLGWDLEVLADDLAGCLFPHGLFADILKKLYKLWMVYKIELTYNYLRMFGDSFDDFMADEYQIQG